jgi:hypothetical protein
MRPPRHLCKSVRIRRFRLETTQSQWFSRFFARGLGLEIAVVFPTLALQNRDAHSATTQRGR